MAVRVAALYLVSTLLLLAVLVVALDRSTEQTLSSARHQDLLTYAADAGFTTAVRPPHTLPSSDHRGASARHG